MLHKILFVLALLLSPLAQAAEDINSSVFPTAREVESESEYKPHFGLTTGVADPSQGFDTALNYGIDAGFQPIIPFSVAAELARYSSDNTYTREKLARTKLIFRGAYNFGGDIPVLNVSYLGLGAGPVFDTRTGSTYTKLGVQPVAGFDLPINPEITIGAMAHYLIIPGNNTPNSWGINGAAKYWF